MTNNSAQKIIILIAALLLSSCSTIFQGTRQRVYINSRPAGAKISIDDKEYGITPNSVLLRRKGRFKDELKPKKEYCLKLEKEGYLPYELSIKRKLDGFYFTNVLLFTAAVYGFPIDAGNGAMYHLKPFEIIATLSKASETGLQNDSLYAVTSIDHDSIILRRPNIWSVSLSGNYMAMKISSFGPEQYWEKSFWAGGFSLGYQRSLKTAFRFTHSRSLPYNNNYNVLLNEGTIQPDTALHVNENWWINDYRFEILIRLNKLIDKRNVISFTTGFGIRNAWFKYQFTPTNEPANSSHGYLPTSMNNIKELDDTYFLLMAGLRLERKFGAFGAFLEPSFDVPFIPDIFDAGTTPTIRYRIGLGTSWYFGNKTRKEPD